MDTAFPSTTSSTSWASATGHCARSSSPRWAASTSRVTLESALKLAEASHDEAFIRLVYEYLPLTFSRRHGDPSRPWNHFAIALKNGNGSEYLNYQGNWRDIFQNWEALALAFPEYIESFIAKFVNASTADGHNPYRVSREGIDWETPDPGIPGRISGTGAITRSPTCSDCSNYRGDYHPGLLARSLAREAFVFADVPYRIKPYREMLRDPRNTVEYDQDRARTIARRVAEIGADGKLVTLDDGSIYRVNLAEKLLLSALARIVNLAPCGGIWMNTQRPEWNDANNALVGHGLSMVTLCYLRRYLHALDDLLRESEAASFSVSRELAGFFEEVHAVLEDHLVLLEGPVTAIGRKSFMDAMGRAGDSYRARVYRGFSGEKSSLERHRLEEFIGLALRFIDHSLQHARRADGLFDSYNLVVFDTAGFDVEPLDEMLEGQVAVLSSGYLDGAAALALLEALKRSRLYCEDRNSYLLYPDRKLPSFLEKNVIPPALVERVDWIQRELEAGRTEYVERDIDGRVHFNAAFRNAGVLRVALERDRSISADDIDRVCDVYEAVFQHRKFTGRSSSMYKYEGLGCIYWHMVSKLLLATAEVTARAVRDGADASLVDRLGARFLDIQAGLGTHRPPAEYGAFPVDPYSHTPSFSGVQQPGLTGQVKEDLITRLWQLGVRVEAGEVVFEPIMLDRREFLKEAASWEYSTGGPTLTEELPAGSLAFTLCGVPVIYRLADSPRLRVLDEEGTPTEISGTRLGPELSRALFRRERRIRKLVVEVPESTLRSPA